MILFMSKINIHEYFYIFDDYASLKWHPKRSAPDKKYI